MVNNIPLKFVYKQVLAGKVTDESQYFALRDFMTRLKIKSGESISTLKAGLFGVG